jgi:hypothetical protein
MPFKRTITPAHLAFKEYKRKRGLRFEYHESKFIVELPNGAKEVISIKNMKLLYKWLDKILSQQRAT